MSIKPVIKYQASPVNPLTVPISVVQKRTDTGSVNWINKAELVDYVDQLYVPPTSDTYMEIACSCGRIFDYTTSDDVPAIDLICSCKNVLIKYGI